MPTDPLPLARALIAAESVTPAGPEAFDALERTLVYAGFEVERMTFAEHGPPVENLWATRGSGRHLALAGHVDVVPPGDPSGWSRPPFGAVVEGDTLWGRGAQDMKGGVAAMTAAAIDWAASGAPGRLSLLVTGDEEGRARDGTRPLVAHVAARQPLDAAIVGEPTSREKLGDTIKVGRRGGLSATVTVTGRQGHSAYPHLADNPIPDLMRIGLALTAPLDRGTQRFDPSTLALVSVDVGNPAWNVIPGRAALRLNVRYNDTWTVDTLRAELIRRVEDAAPGRAEIVFEPHLSDVFLTRDEALIATISAAIETATGVRPEPTTGGGTSDARFIKDFCPVVEFGAVGTLMHQADERTSVAELRSLAKTYRAIIDAVLGV